MLRVQRGPAVGMQFVVDKESMRTIGLSDSAHWLGQRERRKRKRKQQYKERKEETAQATIITPFKQIRRLNGVNLLFSVFSVRSNIVLN